jgi:type I restriction enzyme R subunit
MCIPSIWERAGGAAGGQGRSRPDLKPEAIAKIVNEYHFTQREPLREAIVAALKEKPKILQRKSIIERVKQKLLEIIATFDDR